LRTKSVVGSQTANPTISGCTEHKPVMQLHETNHIKNQKQYLALRLSFNTTRKSVQAVFALSAPFTLSTLQQASAKWS